MKIESPDNYLVASSEEIAYRILTQHHQQVSNSNSCSTSQYGPFQNQKPYILNYAMFGFGLYIYNSGTYVINEQVVRLWFSTASGLRGCNMIVL